MCQPYFSSCTKVIFLWSGSKLFLPVLIHFNQLVLNNAKENLHLSVHTFSLLTPFRVIGVNSFWSQTSYSCLIISSISDPVTLIKTFHTKYKKKTKRCFLYYLHLWTCILLTVREYLCSIRDPKSYYIDLEERI